MIGYGLFYILVGVAHALLMLTAPIWIPVRNLPKAYRAAKAFQDFREKNGEGETE